MSDALGVATVGHGGSRSRARALLVVALAGAAGALVVVMSHARDEVYYLPAYGLGIACAAFAAAAIGSLVVWRSGRVALGLGAMLAGALAVIGTLAILSVGVLLLVAAATLSVLLVSWAGRAAQGAGALVGGALLGIGLAALTVIALSPPLVDCASGRAGENIFLGFKSDSARGSGSGTADRRTTGRVVGDDYAYEYRCDGATLVHFDMTTK